MKKIKIKCSCKDTPHKKSCKIWENITPRNEQEYQINEFNNSIPSVESQQKEYQKDLVKKQKEYQEKITKNNWEENYPIPDKEKWEEKIKIIVKNAFDRKGYTENFTNEIISIVSNLLSQAQSEHNQDCTREEWAREDERKKILKEIKDNFLLDNEWNMTQTIENNQVRDIINLIITNQ